MAMAEPSDAEGKMCMDCQKGAANKLETIRLKCKKHFICESCCDKRELCSEFTGKIRECQKCHPEAFQTQPLKVWTCKVWIYVDDSNLWISGKEAYAKAHKLLTSQDPRARFDIGQLHEVVAEGREVAGRTLYGSKPPPVDTVWAKIEEQGWNVDIKKKSYHTGKEKQVDSQLITDVVSVVNRETIGTVIIVAGDVDYKPPIDEALARGWNVEVWSWEKALAGDIRKHERRGRGLRVEYLNGHINQIMFVNREFDPARFTEVGLLSRLNNASILLTVSEKQSGKSWKDVTDMLQEITRWPISYLEATRAQGFMEVLAIFLYTTDEKPNLDTCIKQIAKAKKKLKLTSSPVQFTSLIDNFGGKPDWLKPLLSQCKAPDADCGEDTSDTWSVLSSRSRRSSGRYRAAEKHLYKTELCRHYAKSSCSKGDQCKFAHGERDPMAWCTICEKTGHIAGDKCEMY